MSFTLEAARQEFLLAKHLEGLSVRTIDIYEEVIGRFAEYSAGTKAVEEITPKVIREHLSMLAQTCNQTTLGFHVKVLKVFFRWLVRNDILSCDPMQAVPKPKEPQPLPRVLTESELQTLMRAARPSPRDYAILVVLLDCGLRASELCNLAVDDIDQKGKSIRVKSGKGGRGRIVFFSDLTARALSRWLVARPDGVFVDALFLSQHHGQPLTRSGLLQLVNRLGKRAGLENGKRVSPHVLRASCATLFVKQGGDAHSLARLLGHSSTRMAERYVSLASEDIREIYNRCSPVKRLNRGHS